MNKYFLTHTFAFSVSCWIIFSGSEVAPQEVERCAMRGNCGYNPPDGAYLPVPCKVDEVPSPVDETSLETLNSLCPELVEEYGNKLCCSEVQINELVQNLETPKVILEICPSCYHNFRQSFCHFTCSPYQRKFVNISETQMLPSEQWNPDSPLIESVKTAKFSLTREYAEGTYDSCKSVILRSTRGPAMDLLCGTWGAVNCQAERWFNYMGSVSNGYAPFDVIYNFVNLEEECPSKSKSSGTRSIKSTSYFHFDTYKCNESSPGSSEVCSCFDCPLSCQSETFPSSTTTIKSITTTIKNLSNQSNHMYHFRNLNSLVGIIILSSYNLLIINNLL